MGLGKARSAAAEPWKLKLYNCAPYDYSTAQILMDKIVECTGQKPGRLKGRITPRVCSSCRRWGHTSQYCAEWEQRYKDTHGEVVRYPQRSVKRDDVIVELTEDEMKWVAHLKAREARREEAEALGLTCLHINEREPATAAWQLTLDCRCTNCVAWIEFMSRPYPNESSDNYV